MLPEHTVAAYQLAVEQGADVIECDVQITKVSYVKRQTLQHDPSSGFCTTTFFRILVSSLVSCTFLRQTH